MSPEVLDPERIDVAKTRLFEGLALAELRRRDRISTTHRGMTHDEATRRKIADSVRRSWARRKAAAVADDLRSSPDPEMQNPMAREVQDRSDQP
jgi:hypothetical protein